MPRFVTMPCVIQFPHPGALPRLESPSKPWSRSTVPHTRAFLAAKGEALESAVPDQIVRGMLHFWGEWEADATVRSAGTGDAVQSLVQVPVLIARRDFTGLHNTDPFVFDGPFLYSNCRQRGVLRHLDRGSVLVFGSTVHGRFLLDTVFVVAKLLVRYRARNAVTDLRAHAPASFIHAVAHPIQASAGCSDSCTPGGEYVLYEGATPTDAVDGMFSFVPAARSPRVFDRPGVTIPDLNPAAARNISILYPRRPVAVEHGAVAEVRPYWASLVNQVLSEGLLLGTRFETAG
jgi:hypothetical protein